MHVIGIHYQKSVWRKKCKVKHKTVPTTNQKCFSTASMEDKEIALHNTAAKYAMCVLAYLVAFRFKSNNALMSQKIPRVSVKLHRG